MPSSDIMNWRTEQAEGLRGRIERDEDFIWFAPFVDGPPTEDKNGEEAK